MITPIRNFDRFRVFCFGDLAEQACFLQKGGFMRCVFSFFLLPVMAFLCSCSLLLGADWQIILPAHPSVTENTAAQELQTHLQQMTGKEFPITLESADMPTDHLLSVGNTLIAQSYIDKEHPEPFKFDEIFVRADGTNLILTGHERRGALYAVYTFLEDNCGCRWYTEEASRIPKYDDLVFPADLIISYAPPLMSREPYHHLAWPSLYSARNKANGHIEETHGGRLAILNGVHSFFHYISPDRYFDAYPEWFSELDGVRVRKDSQLCLTNDEMREELTQNVLADLRAHPETTMIDISQNDQINFCRCKKCKAVDEEEESHAGTLIRFLNQVAADVEKEFPDVLIETLAYQYTRKPPKSVRPRHNIVIRLCSIECDFGRPLDGAEAPGPNREFMKDIEGWGKIAPRLLIWDYVTNYDDYIGPHPNWWVLGPNIRTFVNHGAIGVFEEGEGQDFCEMKNWVLSKLMWNPGLDTETLMNEFAEGYYGEETAPFLMEYWRTLYARLLESGAELGCFRTHSDQWLDLATLNKVTRLWRQAEESVARIYGQDSPQAVRLRKSRTSLDSVWLTRYQSLRIAARRENLPFEGPADFGAAASDFAQCCIDNNFEGPNLYTVGASGLAWFENLPKNIVTPSAIPLAPSSWKITGAGEVAERSLNLDGTNGRVISFYAPCGYDVKDINAEFYLDSEQSAFGVIFGLVDEGNYSFLRLDADSILTGTVGPAMEKFRHEDSGEEPGRWHTIRLRFTDQHKLFALFIDGKCRYEWLFYPRPDQKIGKIGFFAENGKASVRDIYVAGKPD
jgi:hypothetical protein